HRRQRIRPHRARHGDRLHQLPLLACLQSRGLGDHGRRRAADRRVFDTKTHQLIAAGAAPRLDRFLAEHAPELSRSAAARLIKGHLVTVNGHPADPADRVAAGDVVDFEIPEAYVVEAGAEAIPLDIVYEDEDIAVIDKPAGMFARTRYQVVERKLTHTLLRCDLDTGRTHQIRVHLAALGHPVAGDAEYGGGEAGARRPMLHAWRLRLRHPRSGVEMSFEAAPPA